MQVGIWSDIRENVKADGNCDAWSNRTLHGLLQLGWNSYRNGRSDRCSYYMVRGRLYGLPGITYLLKDGCIRLPGIRINVEDNDRVTLYRKGVRGRLQFDVHDDLLWFNGVAYRGYIVVYLSLQWLLNLGVVSIGWCSMQAASWYTYLLICVPWSFCI